MKITEFLDNVHKYMLLERQTDAICARLLTQGDNNADALTEGEKAVFEELNRVQCNIERWLPLFRKGLNCANCKHFDVLYDTWDNMDTLAVLMMAKTNILRWIIFVQILNQKNNYELRLYGMQPRGLR